MALGGALTWVSKLNIPVSLSSCEAELVALTDCAKVAIWMRKLLRAFGISTEKPLIIHEDNQGCIAIATNEKGMTNRTKHVATRHFAIRQFIEDGEIWVVYVPSSDNAADVFTKPLVAVLLYKCAIRLGLCVYRFQMTPFRAP